MPEKPFVPGVDPGLKAWIKMREEVRNARARAGHRHTVTSDTPYRYHRYWIELLKNMDEDQLDDYYSTTDNSSFIPWDSIEFKNSITLQQFQQQLTYRFDIEQSFLDCVQHRSLVILDTLHREGFNLNYRFGPQTQTLLHYACYYGDITKVQYLLDHNAKTHIVNKQGLTPLHVAIKEDSSFHSKQIIEDLIAAGANVNQADKLHGKTPLHIACILQNATLVDLLLSHEADMSIKDFDDKLPCDYTSQTRIWKLFEFYSANHGRKSQYLKMKALILSRSFVGEVFRLVQPKCNVCKRTSSKCQEMKLRDYRYWMFAHQRLAKEFAKPKPTTDEAAALQQSKNKNNNND